MSCSTTYEELARFADGDLPPERLGTLAGHVETCVSCAARLATLRRVETTTRALPPERPSAGTILATRRLLSEETRPRPEPEILTLEEVAAFLRIDLEDLRPFVTELPAFELGGQVRVRRSRLIEWVEQRERAFDRNNMAGAIARIAGGIRKGVA